MYSDGGVMEMQWGPHYCRTSWYHTKQTQKPWVWSLLVCAARSEKATDNGWSQSSIKVWDVLLAAEQTVSPKGDLKGFD